MSVSELVKSLFREASNFIQWLEFNLSTSIDIGHSTKVRAAIISRNVRIGAI